MRMVALGIIFVLTFATCESAEPKTGTVCVAARALDPFSGTGSFLLKAKSIQAGFR